MQISRPAFTNCPWCGTRNPSGAFECARCGGPQPAIEVDDPGPKPPAPPREVPRGYAWQLFLTSSLGLVGAIFLFIGPPFLFLFPILGISTGEWVFLAVGGGLGGLFAALGAIFLFFSLRTIERQQNVYRNGLATHGTVAEIDPDYSITVNGRHPYVVRYTYQVMGIPFAGETRSWQLIVQPGSPLHILYLPDQPAVSAVYPPLSGRKA